jgi:hypothetical protein
VTRCCCQKNRPTASKNGLNYSPTHFLPNLMTLYVDKQCSF